MVATEESLRLRSTLVLLILAAGLGAYAYFVERPAREEAAQKKRLLDFDRNAVKEITLTYPDHEIRLVKGANDQWQIAAPLAVAADQTAVTNLLNAIADAELTRTIEDPGEDAAQYGFDTPTVTIRVTVAEGPSPPLLTVGKQTPIGFKAYARKENDPKVYLTTGAFHSGVKKETKDLRDKTVIGFSEADVRTISLVKPDVPAIQLSRTDGAWTITEPGQWPADAGEVGGLLSALQALRAQDFIDQPEEGTTYGLDAPRLRVTLSLKDAEAPKGVLLGGDAPGTPKTIYARAADNGTIYKLPSWTLANLDKDVAKLRDRQVLAFDADAARQVTVTPRGGPAVTLRRADDGTWSVEGSTGTPKESAITRFVSDLRQTKPADIVSDNAADFPTYGLDDPDLRITVTGREESPIGTLLATTQGGTDDGGDRYYFAREGSPTIYSGAQYLFTRIDKGRSDFVDEPKAGAEKGAEQNAEQADEGDD